jgi:hypothetical protein
VRRFDAEARLVADALQPGERGDEVDGVATALHTDQQIATLATWPVLAVFGDHRDTPAGISTRPSWQISFDSCQALIGRLKAAGGDAQMLNPPDRGIRGNSHILQWIDEHVGKRSSGNR